MHTLNCIGRLVDIGLAYVGRWGALSFNFNYYYLFGRWLDLHCVDSQFQFQFFPSRLRWLVKRTLVNFNSYHSHVGRWLADCPALSFRFVYLHNKQISKCKTVEFVAGPALR